MPIIGEDVVVFLSKFETSPWNHPSEAGPQKSSGSWCFGRLADSGQFDATGGLTSPTDVGQTMPFLPAMTENGKFIPPTKMVMAGGWFYYCTHMIVNFSS